MDKQLKHLVVYDNENKNFRVNEKNKSKLIFLSNNKRLYSAEGKPLVYINADTWHFRINNQGNFNGKEYYNTEGGGMSLEHLEVQKQIQNLLEEIVDNFTLEKRLDIENEDRGRIADCYFEYNNNKYVIEVQKSNIPTSVFEERTNDYEKLGIKCVWITLINLKDKKTLSLPDKSYESNGGYTLILEYDNCEIDIRNIIKNRTHSKKDKIVFDFRNNIKQIIKYLFEKDYGTDLDEYFKEMKEIKYNYLYFSDNLEEIKEDYSINLKRRNYIKEELIKLNPEKKNLNIEVDNLKKELSKLKVDYKYKDSLEKNVKELSKNKIELNLELKDLNFNIDKFKNLYLDFEEKLKFLNKEIVDKREKIKECDKRILEYDKIINNYEIAHGDKLKSFTQYFKEKTLEQEKLEKRLKYIQETYIYFKKLTWAQKKEAFKKEFENNRLFRNYILNDWEEKK